jgi:hypothetical protein
VFASPLEYSGARPCLDNGKEMKRGVCLTDNERLRIVGFDTKTNLVFPFLPYKRLGKSDRCLLCFLKTLIILPTNLI